MKKLLSSLFLSMSLIASGTNYYVKNGGNNSLSGLDDKNAWESISKVNSFSFAAGDSILFKCDNKFIGTLIPPSDGSAGNHIVFGSYGSGDKPILTPNNVVTGITWTAYGMDGIYSTTDIPYNPGNLLINWGNKINKINNNWFANKNPHYNDWTALDFMRLPADASWTMNGIAHVKFWDALEALYCYDDATGTTYLRFRNGENPNDSLFAFSQTGVTYAAIKIVSKDYITIQNLYIIGGDYGIYIVGPTSVTSDNITVENCTIKSSNEKISISSSDAVIVRNCTITNNYLSSYSPGAWENATTYEDGVQYMYYYFFKLVIDVNSSTRADGAITMSGGMSDNCSFYNNSIEGCVNGIQLFGHTMNCYSNSITGTSSVGIFIDPVGPTYTYDNYLVDTNIGFRFGGIDRTTYTNRIHYVYKNRVYIPNAGQVMYLHYDGTGPSVTEAYIYHNSFIAYEGIQVSSDANGYLDNGTGFVLVNNIISTSWQSFTGWSSMDDHDNLFICDYNWISGRYYGSASAVWVPVPHNIKYPPGPTFWDHSIDPPDFTKVAGTEVIDAGIDLSKTFTISGVNYSPLPGMNPGYYNGTAPDLGAVEFSESVPKPVTNNLALFSNPNHGNFSISFSEPYITARSDVKVISLNGKIVYQGILEPNDLYKEFSFPYIAPGLYVLIISTDEIIILVKKFIKL